MSRKNIFKILISSAAFLIVLALVFVLCLSCGKREAASAVFEKEKNSEPFCVLVMGTDRVSELADVIMLVSFDEDSGSVCVMQIPRDTYILYGNGNHRKINSAAKLLGGEEQLCELLSEALGVSINGYVSFGLDTFRKSVDMLGGVEMELDEALHYSDPEQGLYIDLPKGKQQLDGKKAEMLVRFRSGYAGGDIERLDAQKKFLTALFAKAQTSVNISNIYGFATEILPDIKTDIKETKLVSLGLGALKSNAQNISLLTLPGEAATSNVSGASFYIMSAPATNKVLCKYFGKNDTEMDKNRIFVHDGYANFKKIYESDRDFVVSSAQND